MDVNWLSILIAVILLVISSVLINYHNRLGGASCDSDPNKKCLGSFDNFVYWVAVVALVLPIIYFVVMGISLAREYKLHEKIGLGGKVRSSPVTGTEMVFGRY